MSVRDRLEDAKCLWENGRKHGAWIQVLIATAATSRQRFPADNDGTAFKKLIRELTPTIVNGTSPPVTGGVTIVFALSATEAIEMADVIYKHLRCNLLHEATMPTEVRLSDSALVDGKLVAQLQVVSPLTIPDFWVLHLAIAVAAAPENAESCAGLFGQPPSSGPAHEGPDTGAH